MGQKIVFKSGWRKLELWGVKMDEAIVKQFNIYCDESRVENPDSRYMVIGALFVPRAKARELTQELNKLYGSFKFFQELKWNKVGSKYLDFYKRIVDYFLKADAMQFRCIIVDKQKVRYEVFHENDRELAFFKFYYLMLRSRLSDNNHYYIFLDKKPTRDKNRARSLKAFLDSYVLLHRNNCNIKHLQSYPSNENKLIQLTDFLTGLIAFACNKSKGKHKMGIVEFLEFKLGRKVTISTSLTEVKFNIFVWDESL